MAAYTRNFARNSFSNVFTKSACNLLGRIVVPEEWVKSSFCRRCFCSYNSTSSRYSGVKRGWDKPQRRKILRKIKSDIYRKNSLNPDMEKAARTRKLLVPLDDVRKGWTPKQYPHQVMMMATYYGIYQHMFNGVKFMPRVLMDVDYEDVGIHYGNFIEPVKTSCEPQVGYDVGKDLLTTLLMVNLDGNILSKDHEILHWMVGNIPNGNIKEGDYISGYLPPCPVKGTGFHRFVFCLLNQKEECNFEEIHRRHDSRNLVNRSFKTVAFLKTFQDQLDPVGLSFFQATWDKTVMDTFTEILGTKEPIYDLEPFLLPNQKKNLEVYNIFDKKYRNM